MMTVMIYDAWIFFSAMFFSLAARNVSLTFSYLFVNDVTTIRICVTLNSQDNPDNRHLYYLPKYSHASSINLQGTNFLVTSDVNRTAERGLHFTDPVVDVGRTINCMQYSEPVREDSLFLAWGGVTSSRNPYNFRESPYLRKLFLHVPLCYSRIPKYRRLRNFRPPPKDASKNFCPL